jgi:glycerol-3-phosphate dehydrogenase
VLLAEKHDFGWGTTWRSTKLIHGGLRYLEHAEFGLVFESLRDQARLLRDYPGMVRPLEFLLPVFARDTHLPGTIEIGLTIYDLLSWGRGLPRHRRRSPHEALRLEPGLRREGLRAVFTYSDCQVPFPERLCLQTALEARCAGATLRNYTQVTGLLVDRSGRVKGVELRDLRSGAEAEVRCSLVVNAAGPWVDAVLRGLPAVSVPPQIGGTKGTHVVVEYPANGPTRAIYAEARSDHRPFFIVPWRGKHLIGTTDTRFEGDPDDVAASAADIDYLLREANALLPGAPLQPSAVAYAYAGVRPLPASDGVATGAITRRHIIRDHREDGHPGLLSIIGGKLSTYRSLAAQTLERIRKQIRVVQPSGDQRHCAYAESDARTEDVPSGLAALAPQLVDYLRAVYGPRLESLSRLLTARPELARPLCPHGPDIEGQIVLAAREEQATTLADALMRRSGAAWNRCLGLDCARHAAQLMAGELGWHADALAVELEAYLREVRRTFTLPGREMPHFPEIASP